MCGRAYSPNFLFIWPTARISVMGGVQVRMFILVNASQPLLNFIYCFTSNIIVQLSIHVFEPVTALSSILMVAIYT
jgi:hypothetical protein